MGPEIVNDAQEIKIRSEIKAGEFLKTMEKQNGRPSSKRLQGVTLLSEMGIQRIQSHRWQKKTAFALLYFSYVAVPQRLCNARTVCQELTCIID